MRDKKAIQKVFCATQNWEINLLFYHKQVASKIQAHFYVCKRSKQRHSKQAKTQFLEKNRITKQALLI